MDLKLFRVISGYVNQSETVDLAVKGPLKDRYISSTLVLVLQIRQHVRSAHCQRRRFVIADPEPVVT